VVAGLPRHLTPGGTCQIVTDMVFQADLPYRIKLRQWLGVEQGKEYDVLVVVTNSFDPFEYALDHESKEMPGTLEERAKGFSSRMECYEQMKVGVFRHGVITLRRSPAERQGWYHERYVTSGPVDLAPAIDQALQRIGRVEGEDLLNGLSESRPTIREGTVLDRRQVLGPGGDPSAESIEVIPPAAVWQEEQARLSEERLRRLLLCDGSRTVGQILASTGAGPSDAPTDRLKAAKQLLQLYEMGVIDL
jgi:hypothetical protein